MGPKDQMAVGLAFGVFVGVTPWMFWNLVGVLSWIRG
jgi:hypothetical protein